VIDTRDLRIVQTLNPGPGVLHLEFEPKGEAVWVSVRAAAREDVYDTATFARTATLPAEKPSGIFLTDRAGRIGL
jgi:protein NirF